MNIATATYDIDTVIERIPLIDPATPALSEPTRTERSACKVDLLDPLPYDDMTLLRQKLRQAMPNHLHLVSTVSSRQPVDGLVTMKSFNCDCDPTEPDLHYHYDGGGIALNSTAQARSELEFHFDEPGDYIAELCIRTHKRNVIAKPSLRRRIIGPDLAMWMWHHSHYLISMNQNRLVFRFRLDDPKQAALKLEFLSFSREVLFYWGAFVQLQNCN